MLISKQKLVAFLQIYFNYRQWWAILLAHKEWNNSEGATETQFRWAAYWFSVCISVCSKLITHIALCNCNHQFYIVHLQEKSLRSPPCRTTYSHNRTEWFQAVNEKEAKKGQEAHVIDCLASYSRKMCRTQQCFSAAPWMFGFDLLCHIDYRYVYYLLCLLFTVSLLYGFCMF